MIPSPTIYRVLLVDDEPDLLAVERLALRGLQYRDREVEILTAGSGKETVEMMKRLPDVAVILLDVVMERETAGFEACRAIREELGNRFVRILLRTGQPGIAPERESIDLYDIDGYLPKAELTLTRLYAAVRTGLKAFDELVALERHRAFLEELHEAVLGLHAFEPLPTTLGRLTAAAKRLTGARDVLLDLESIDETGNPRRLVVGDGDAASLRSEVARRGVSSPTELCEGYVVPIVLHRALGNGFLYVEGAPLDDLARRMLALLAAHAGNALYATVAQQVLAAREGAFYDAVPV
jgi:CheY-like chemotaxis protein